jgi:hypothetical protein
MEDYLSYDASGNVIGMVSAINGDMAWLLAQLANPNAVQLKVRVHGLQLAA